MKRQERRFVPQSGASPWLVRSTGALGAAALGAGTWSTVYGHGFETSEKLKAVPQYLITGGAVLTAISIWFATSSEPRLRVGDAGIGIEQGEVRRMPWWGIDAIVWEPGTRALGITGKDESGVPLTFKVPLKDHAEAIPYIIAEGEARIPKCVDIPNKVREQLPASSPHAGTPIDLEPLQIVGKRCSATGKTISYEPDGRVCPRCERVYFKSAVPKKCKCGSSLNDLRSKAAANANATADSDAQEPARDHEGDLADESCESSARNEVEST
ncbi:MAG: hypothetical protein FWD73_02260 [Polyangiaceae bacterium]|nr:hypothetical protein [Polyangiaceae bacterium]